MSDPSVAQDAPDVQNGHQHLTFLQRVNLEALAIFAKRDMVADGAIDPYAIADEIEPTILEAIAEKEADRTKVGVTPTHLMEKHFSEVPKKSDVETDDEDVLEMVDAVYGKVKEQVFRVLNIMPDGIIQSRLATNGGSYTLCRMKGKRGAEELAYVTRNRKLMHIDNNDPAYRKVELAMKRASALTGLSIERVPEHGKWFQRQHKRAMQLSLDASNDVVIAALDAGDDQPADGPVEDGDE
jgi:hypothetical protein